MFLLVLRRWALGSAGSAGRRAASGTFVASTKNGDWPAYTGDTRGSRYSPLDQINAGNFNDLEVAWRFKTDNLGCRPEYKLEGTPLVVDGVLYTTAGTRRSVDRARRRDRRDDLGAPLSGRRARRQRAAPALGPRPRLLDRRPGRRPHHLRDPRLPPDRARREDRPAGQDLRQGRRRRSQSRRGLRHRPADRSRDRGDRAALDADRGQRHRPGRLRDEGRDDRQDANNTKGLARAFDVAHRQADLELPDDPQAGRRRRRHLVEQLLGDQRQHRRVDADHRRRERSASSTCRSSRRAPTTTAASVRARTCSARASSASICRPASASGTSSSSTIRSGITTCRRRRSSPT